MLRTEFEIGQRVFVDNNKESVTVISQTEKKLITTVRADNGYEWEVMTIRVKDKLNENNI